MRKMAGKMLAMALAVAAVFALLPALALPVAAETVIDLDELVTNEVNVPDGGAGWAYTHNGGAGSALAITGDADYKVTGSHYSITVTVSVGAGYTVTIDAAIAGRTSSPDNTPGDNCVVHSGAGEVVIEAGGSVTGGKGGGDANFTEGSIGGDGIVNSAGGNITIIGSAAGGDGGSATTTGAYGGSGVLNSGSGTVTVQGSATGGNGGSALHFGGGHRGGAGVVNSAGGSVIISGSATGGKGGQGASPGGGEGGAGVANLGAGNANVSGTARGGNAGVSISGGSNGGVGVYNSVTGSITVSGIASGGNGNNFGHGGHGVSTLGGSVLFSGTATGGNGDSNPGNGGAGVYAGTGSVTVSGTASGTGGRSGTSGTSGGQGIYAAKIVFADASTTLTVRNGTKGASTTQTGTLAVEKDAAVLVPTWWSVQPALDLTSGTPDGSSITLNTTSEHQTIIALAPTYGVTVNTAAGGTATASPTTAVAGTEVTLTATPGADHPFTRWNVSPAVTFTKGTSNTSNPATFTLPAADVVVTPVFKPLALAGGALPDGVEGVPYTHSLSADATGGLPPYLFEVDAGSALPDGLALSPAGVISGAPAAAGSYSFALKVTDSQGVPASATAQYTLDVAPAPTTPAVLPGALSLTTGEMGALAVFLGHVGTRAAQADLTANSAPAVAAADPASFTAEGTVTVTGLAAGTTVLTFTFSGGDLAAPAEVLVAVTVADPPPPTYTLSVVNGTDLTAGGPYTAGAQVAIAANAPPEGQVFAGWTGGDGGAFADAAAAETVFTMPAASATVAATYKAVEIPYYTITVAASPAEGGAVSGGGAYAQNTGHTVTAAANTGYTFQSWTEGGAVVSTEASYTFTVGANRGLVANFTYTGGAGNGPGAESRPGTLTSPATGDNGDALGWLWLAVGAALPAGVAGIALGRQKGAGGGRGARRR